MRSKHRAATEKNRKVSKVSPIGGLILAQTTNRVKKTSVSLVIFGEKWSFQNYNLAMTDK